MNQLADLASSADHDLEELLWENHNVLARQLSTNPSRSFQSPRARTKSQGDIHRTKRPMLGAVDSILRGSCLSSLEPTNKHNTPLPDDHGPELSLGLFDSHFNMFLDAEEIAHGDKHLREPHVVPVYEEANPRTSNSSIFVDGIPELTTARTIGEPRQSSMETWADPISQQLLVDSRTPAPLSGLTDSNLQKVNSGSDKCLTLQNFSFFLRSAALGKGDAQVSDATRPTSGSSPLVPEQSKSNYVKPPEGGGNLFELPLTEKSCDSKSLKGFQSRLDPKATKLVPITPVTKPPELSPPPDEQSEAIVPKCFTKRKRWPDQAPGLASGLLENTIKGKPDARRSVDQDAATTSSCSRRASNDVKSLKRRCEHTERMACRSEEIKKGGNKTTQKHARGSAGSKKRTKEGHKLSERRRRNKINKKISKLQKLIPYCDKVDKASILDEVISYLKALQFQVQIMSIGTGIMCMPPMMIPTGMQPMQAPHSAHFSPMGLRMNLGFGYNTAPFPTSPILGLQGQVLPKSVPIAPFIPFGDGYFANIPGRVTSEELHAPAPFSSSNNIAPGDQKLSRMETLHSQIFKNQFRL